MIPLVDTHVHLLAGLDDGPDSVDDAVAMCRMAYDEGTRVMAATAHINEQWPQSNAQRIRSGTRQLQAELAAADVPMTVYPCAEVMICPELEQMWQAGQLVGMADRPGYLLVELPFGQYFDIRSLVQAMGRQGVRLVLAHPERHPELLHEPGNIEQLIRLGCVVQASAESFGDPLVRYDLRALRQWIQRGVVHIVCSDGHSPMGRPPHMAAAYRQIVQWAGAETAGRLCSINGLTVLEGRPLAAPEPKPPQRRWFSFC